MQPENEHQELDLIQLAFRILKILKRNFFLVFIFSLAGFFSGIYISNTGIKRGKDFYKQEFVLKSACSVEYLNYVTRSLTVQLIKGKSGSLNSLRSIEPNAVLKDPSGLRITFSAFDTTTIVEALSAFKRELINHEGLNKEHEKQMAIKFSFLKDLKLITDSVCRSGNKMTEACLALLEKKSAIEMELQTAALFEINMVDNHPVYVSQRNERNLLLTGLSVIGLLAGLMVAFLIESYKPADKKKS